MKNTHDNIDYQIAELGAGGLLLFCSFFIILAIPFLLIDGQYKTALQATGTLLLLFLMWRN